MILVSMLLACGSLADLPPARQQSALSAALAEMDGANVLYLTGAGLERPVAAASGAADPRSGLPIDVDTPLRIASITKTFVAAAILRLAERDLIDLDGAVAPLVDPGLAQVLNDDGYDLARITVRQLLNHSAGLYDHAADPRYIASVFAAPDRRWTREALMRLLTEYGDPVGEPGGQFHYSDSGYVLLGDIVERLTGLPLAQVVRDELRFDELELASTWWELAEPAPAGAGSRARQFMDGRDATDLHASFDLYGGGGLVMSARDLATWFAALFEGRIFERPETLAMMTSQGDHRGAERYRLGLLADGAPDGEIYGHSGFWGTVVYYHPARRVAVAGYTTRRETYRTGILPLVKEVIGGNPKICSRDGGVTPP